ncbi:unnamed protein product [Adineta ricciae]|uniref:Uncharacterized protein n=1 Tax=Adineta ricciae TaxID=249248 RepID=A0A816BZJ4_ADIRI|nr:unnamed protein product [Adineta ricciae]
MIVLSIFFGLFALTTGQTCRNLPLYARCSTNPDCGCLPFSSVDDQSGICAYLHLNPTKLRACNEYNYYCDQPYTVCVHHPSLSTTKPLCYPTGMASLDICPPLDHSWTSSATTTTTVASISVEELCANVSWSQVGKTAAGSNFTGNATNQLRNPTAILFDSKTDTLYVADTTNARIVTWHIDADHGVLVAGGNGNGNRSDQFDWISSMVLNPADGSLIVCDARNRRIVRWYPGVIDGEILAHSIYCSGLALDKQGFLYMTEFENQRVTRWTLGSNLKFDSIVAGNNGRGNRLDQLYGPMNIFVDENQTVFISDNSNNRIVKWPKGATEGILVGNIHYPKGIRVTSSGNVYAIDSYYSRVIRWTPNDANGTVIIGEKQYTLSQPADLDLDANGNIYVCLYGKHRVEKFNLDKKECL